MHTVSETAISIQNFTKTYPVPRQKEKRVAVDNLTLEVAAGGLFGFLGPNGAGKTTTIKMLLGFIPPTQGGAWLFGVPVTDDDARRRVGYLPEQPYFPKFLSAIEVVRAHAGLSGLTGSRAQERVEACLRQVGMWDSRHMPLAKCSKGMTQRVGLASALVGDPDLLIMDEPSSGLDPVGRKELHTLLMALQNAGKTIFLSSHLLSEMESFCDRVGVLSSGRLVACGTPAEITQTRDEVAVQIAQDERDEVLAQEVTAWGGSVEALEGDQSRVLVPPERVYGLLGLLEKRRARLIAVTPQRETLEEAFLRLVG
jgi:ABC-2 type transport system ATP-binding protein